MAVVSVIALLAALGAGALAVLQPWRDESLAPSLGLASGLGVGLGRSVAVSSSGGGPALASARPAAGATPKLAAGGVLAGEGEAEAPRVGLDPARAVVTASPVSPPEGEPAPAAPETPAPATSPPPAVVPVAALTPAPGAIPPSGAPLGSGSGPQGPIGSGTGPVEPEPGGAIAVGAGDEGALAFSFLVQPAAYRAPGEESLILRLVGAAGGDPSFGLQLWDDGGEQRGLWASGDAMGGERFLAPLADGVWHRLAVAFKASSEGDGLYLVLLDGEPIDARASVSLIEPGTDAAAIEAGLFRGGERVEGSGEVLFGALESGPTLESVLP